MALIDNLISAYKFDNTSGVIVDSIDSNDLTNHGITRGVTGIQANGIQLAAGNYAEASYNANFDIIDYISIEAWVKTTGTGNYQTIICHPVNDSSHVSPYYSWALIVKDNGVADFFIGLYGNREAFGTTDLRDGNWHQIIGAYNSANATLRLYVDGILEDENTSVGSMTAGNNVMRIGENGGFGEQFIGFLDEVRIWNRELSQAEVTELYNSGDGRQLSYITGSTPPTYNLTLSVSPAGYGSATDNTNTGPYEQGSTINVTAAPASGYRFVNWTVGGTEVSTQATFNYTMPGEDTILVANFEIIPVYSSFLYTHFIEDEEIQPFDLRNNSIIIEKDDNRMFYRKKLNGNITIADISRLNIEDYTLISGIEKGTNATYDRQQLFSYTIKENGVDWFDGYFNIYNVSFEPSRKIANIEITAKDNYTDVLAKFDTEINILDNTTYEVHVPIKMEIVANIQYGDDTFTADNIYDSWVTGTTPSGSDQYMYLLINFKILVSEGIDPGTDWVYDSQITNTDGSISDVYYNTFSMSTIFDGTEGIEYLTGITSMPSGKSVLIYPMRRDLSKVIVISTDFYPGFLWSSIEKTRYYVKLKDVMSAYMTAIGFSGIYKSSFFDNDAYDSDKGGNPGTKNYYSQISPNPMNDLIICSESDMKKPFATEQDSSVLCTLNKMITVLKDMFNVDWFIDSDGNFRIEHISYFTKEKNFDLTTNYLKYFKTKTNYQYNTQDQCNQEKWSFYKGGNNDFSEVAIDYDQITLVLGQEKKVVKKSIEATTDITLAQSADFAYDSNGLFFLAVIPATSGFDIAEETGLKTGLTMKNGHLSTYNLVEHYHNFNRPFISGKIDGVTINFVTMRKIAKGEQIEIKSFVGQIIDVYKLIKTELGYGEVDKLEYFLDGRIKLDLLYPEGLAIYLVDETGQYLVDKNGKKLLTF